MTEGTMITELIEQLEDTNLMKRAQVKLKLLACGLQAVEPLICALHDQARYKNWEAASLLGQLHDLRSVVPLLRVLVSRNPILGQVAAEALLGFDLKPYYCELIEALFSCHATVKSLIVGLIEKTGEPAAVPVLVGLLTETPAPSIRVAIIEALGNLGDPRAINTLRAFECDPDAHLRSRIQIALQKLRTC
jgi:HEAT repeat protein